MRGLIPLLKPELRCLTDTKIKWQTDRWMGVSTKSQADTPLSAHSVALLLKRVLLSIASRGNYVVPADSINLNNTYFRITLLGIKAIASEKKTSNF